ncbi:hypothetical protein N1031_04870 [Herbiconiux moechotypicola]|uniref:Lipoprotein n=1 Tax=Herbiconiux moechotypicola TaxID=637393 RepID=A0ABN3D9D5_9MICO|nr:hypothetical protein [Herbiconiux moechotypicola]MCS5729085.1 hypothetical protein [Herbiconiux moechotypicola]
MARVKSSAWGSAAGVMLVVGVLAGALGGCAGPTTGGDTGSPPGEVPTVATAEPSPVPIEEVVEIDPGAEQLVTDARELVTASDGWATLEARTALDAATQALARDIEVAQLSMAGGPAASQADPPVTAESAAVDFESVLTATGVVRDGVVATAIEVVNVGAAQAEQTLRDALYTAIVTQQQSGVTAETPRALVALLAAGRAAQDSQLAYNEEQARLAAEQAAAGGSGESGSGGEIVWRAPPGYYDNPHEVCNVVEGTEFCWIAPW